MENIPDQINLLSDFEISKTGEEDLWIEPGETSHYGCGLILPEGHYLATVTFIGTREREDFWRRIFYIRIPPVEGCKVTKEKPIAGV